MAPTEKQPGPTDEEHRAARLRIASASSSKQLNSTEPEPPVRSKSGPLGRISRREGR